MLEYCGQQISAPLIKSLDSVKNSIDEKNDFYQEMLYLTSEIEIEALMNRLNAMLNDPTIPILDPNRDVPWPFV